MVEKEDEIVNEIHKEFNNQFVVLFSIAGAWVCGSFWQMAINDAIKNIFPTGGVWMYELIVALIITIIIAVAIIIVSTKLKKEEKK